MWRKLLWTGLACAAVLPGAGCRSTCKSKGRADATLPPPPGGGSPYLGPPVAPSAADDRFPPPFPAPGGADRLPPQNIPVPPDAPRTPPPEIPDSRNSLRIDPTFPPPASAPAPKPARELLLPDAAPAAPLGEVPADGGANPSTSGFLGEPVRPAGPAKPTSPPPAAGTDRPPPAAKAEPSAPPPGPDKPPVGVPGYAALADKPGVFVGRRPTVDGFDALKAAGVRTVVYLHGPDADPSPAKELAEKRGLRFEPVAVSPETLSRAAPAFNALVSDKTARPVFVSDDTGARAGILWFLYFQTVDLLGDDAAKVRAAPLGLKDAGTGDEMTRYWLAANEYLSKR